MKNFCEYILNRYELSLKNTLKQFNYAIISLNLELTAYELSLIHTCQAWCNIKVFTYTQAVLTIKTSYLILWMLHP